MKLRNFLLRLSAALAAAIIVSACNKPADTSPETKQTSGARSIAVIPKGTTHVFWKSVEAGARQAGQELGVNIVWKGPLKENDRAQQIAIVEQFASEGVSGIVLAPLDDTALRRPVQAAMAKNIPVVIIDSALKGEAGKDFAGYVGTNNKLGGQLAGEHLVKLLGGKGKVVLLRYMEGSASTTEREAGFLEAVKKAPEIQLIVDNRYAGATASEAQTAALNMLDQLRQADGIFASNESATFGLLLALRQNNLAGRAKFVGFDTSPPLVEALKKGELHALIAQNPRKIGYEGVKAMVAKLDGGDVPASTDTGVQLITPENLSTPEIQELIK
ncbi:MAG TPA: substrate-binding domain-containing protein [Chthoniobacteraceae bacterium]|nr:substrate-binding domain-containing protein [Chthoniobacteraceae bacterium]